MKSHRGNTPLMIFCKRNHIELTKLFLQNEDINIEEENNTGDTAFDLACSLGNVEIARLFILEYSKREIPLNLERVLTSCIQGNSNFNMIKLLFFEYGAYLQVENIKLKESTLKSYSIQEHPDSYSKSICFSLEHDIDNNFLIAKILEHIKHEQEMGNHTKNNIHSNMIKNRILEITILKNTLQSIWWDESCLIDMILDFAYGKIQLEKILPKIEEEEEKNVVVVQPE